MVWRVFKNDGQSLVEMSFIIGLVIIVGWSSLEIITSRMKQGSSNYSKQYSGVTENKGGISPYNNSNYSAQPVQGQTYAPLPVAAVPTVPDVPANGGQSPAEAGSSWGCQGCQNSQTNDLF